MGVLPFPNPRYLGIEWDAENRLLAVKQGSTTLASFTYDGRGLRATKTAGGIQSTYLYERSHVVEERKNVGGTVRYFFGEGMDDVLAKQDSGSAFYYAKDHLRGVRQVTNASGDVIATRDYDAWGNPLAGATNGGFAFTGRDWDPEIGLYHYRARYYDAGLGRFISEDPLRFEGDANFYAYVANNPVRFSDPFGLEVYPPPKWSPPCPTALVIGKKAFAVMKQHGTRFTHCWASCEIAKACGPETAENWQDIKEWYDWAVCGLLGVDGNCDSAFQPDDYYDNYTGRSCPASQSCWDRCRSLMGAPEPPPGPYGQ